jgi:antitoxin component of RelBE/YafQ-DinJ toxin-antitoxin module
MEAIAFRVPAAVKAAICRIAHELNTTPSTAARLLIQSALSQTADTGVIALPVATVTAPTT